MSKSPILIASLATLIAGGAYAQQPPAPVVQVAHVAETEVAPTVAVPGTIYSRNDVQVTAGVAGQLIMVAEPGTLVSAGDAVARIDRTPLLLQRAEQEVLLERAEINIRQLNSQLRRQQELQGSSLVSEFELEQTVANRDLAVADAKLIKVRMQQIDDQIRRADIRAPFSGVITTRLHRAGEDVSRGEVLAAMTDIRNMEVRAFVPLKHLPRTVVGDAIDIGRLVAHHAAVVGTGIEPANVIAPDDEDVRLVLGVCCAQSEEADKRKQKRLGKALADACCGYKSTGHE